MPTPQKVDIDRCAVSMDGKPPLFTQLREGEYALVFIMSQHPASPKMAIAHFSAGEKSQRMINKGVGKLFDYNFCVAQVHVSLYANKSDSATSEDVENKIKTALGHHNSVLLSPKADNLEAKQSSCIKVENGDIDENYELQSNKTEKENGSTVKGAFSFLVKCSW